MQKINKGRRGVNLFLLELIIVLLFFSISCAVILNMFSIADSKISKSLANEKMLLCAQSVSEIFASSGSMDDVTDRLFGGIVTNDPDGARTVYVDRELNPIKNEAAAFAVLKFRETKDERAGGVYSRLEYEFRSGGEVTFSGFSSAYIPDFEVNGNER